MVLNKDIQPFYIEIRNTPEELEVINSKIANFNPNSPRFLEILTISVEIKKQIYHDINDTTSVIFCTPEMVEKIMVANEYHGYTFKVKRANKLLFENKIDLSTTDKTFKNIINQWIYNNFDCNDVLDKQLSGLELTEVDFLILENN